MGRFKKVIEENGIDKRELGYYSTPDFVAKYIAKRMLQINDEGIKVLDPGCGREELLEVFLNRKKEVFGIDIVRLKDKYECNFKQSDFINFYSELKDKSPIEQLIDDTKNSLPLDYDYYIANPPYNCHEVDYIKNNKKALKKIFDDVGVHNMYSMFISAIIDCAKQGAIIGLLTHDSFFTAKYHDKLRYKILEQCAIHEITMCPNDLFTDQKADVRTSILILQKGKLYQKKVIANNRPNSKKAFKKQLEKQLEDYKQLDNTLKYDLEDIILHHKKDNHEFIIECPDDIKRLFKNERIQDRYKCVTGISTGNDKKYLSENKKGPFTIPFYKNPGKNRFYTDNYIYLHKDFLEFDKKIKNFMVRNKDLLFKPGITCSSMGVEFTAAKLPENSTYGVNANIICDDEVSWWLMAYLNSELVTYIVRGVINRSNMITSGYVSRIPLIDFSKEEKVELTSLSKQAFEMAKKKESYKKPLSKINEIVYKASKVSNSTIKMIKEFKKDLIKNT